MKSKYSYEIYEITKVNNNSLIIKNDKNDQTNIIEGKRNRIQRVM